MSNISTVKSALDAEIQHAKQGIAFYAARIATLEHILGQLDHLQADTTGAPSIKAIGKRANAKRNGPAGSAKDAVTVKLAKAAKPAKPARGAALPKTGNAFWQSLLSATPMSNQELLSAAIVSLGIRPTETELKKLKQRLANAVTIMTREGSMQSQGSGRARRFTSAAGAAD